MKLDLFMPEDQIVWKGEDGDALYIVAKGDASVYITNQFNIEVFVQDLHIGDMFGEIALLKDCKWTATVISKNYSTVAWLEEIEFMETKARHPDFMWKLNEKILQYWDPWKMFIFWTLHNVDMFSHGLSV